MQTQTFKRTAVVLAAVVLAAMIGLVALSMPSQAEAKTVTTKATTMAAAKTIKKGTTTVKAKANTSYVKFKAKKTKKYTFTVSSLNALTKAGKKRNFFNGNISLYTGSPSMHKNLKVKTKGGKAYSLYLCTKNYYKTSSKYNKKVSAYTHLPKRSFTVKLKKGTTLYMSSWFTVRGGASYKVKIK
ncbi:MAG: hypothetical protein ACOX1O_04810 [Eggerthellaceae bacterium]|jgi:hypothetical protein